MRVSGKSRILMARMRLDQEFRTYKSLSWFVDFGQVVDQKVNS